MSTFLVTLATGQQGMATVAALLKNGAKVHAVVRDPTKPAAQELERQGVVLFKGSNDDFDTFRDAAKGCSGLFLNLVSWPENVDSDKQAIGILEACKEVGVEHVVVSTAGWVGDQGKWDRPQNEGWLANFCKDEALVEDAVRCSGIRHFTILRPFWFHSNYLQPAVQYFYPDLPIKGELVHSFKPGRIFPHINVDDIGRFAAMALLDPTALSGQEIELASENLSIEAVANTIQKITGREVALRARTPEEEQAEDPNTPWHRWANTVDLTVDTDALKRKFNFHFTTLEEYLTQEKTRLVLPA